MRERLSARIGELERCVKRAAVLHKAPDNQVKAEASRCIRFRMGLTRAELFLWQTWLAADGQPPDFAHDFFDGRACDVLALRIFQTLERLEAEYSNEHSNRTLARGGQRR